MAVFLPRRCPEIARHGWSRGIEPELDGQGLFSVRFGQKMH